MTYWTDLEAIQSPLVGLNYVWEPDFSLLSNPAVWLAAAGQIFFTLSIGIALLLAGLSAALLTLLPAWAAGPPTPRNQAAPMRLLDEPLTCLMGVYLQDMRDYKFADRSLFASIRLWSVCPTADSSPLKDLNVINANGTTISEIITINRGDHNMAQTKLGDSIGHLGGLLRIKRLRQTRAHIAEGASACASVAHDHEGRVLLLPAFANVGAAGLFADGVKAVGADDLVGCGVALRHRRANADPVRLAQHGCVRPVRLLGMARAASGVIEHDGHRFRPLLLPTYGPGPVTATRLPGPYLCDCADTRFRALLG